MKKILFVQILFFTFSSFFLQEIKAQTIEQDSILANKYFQKAEKYINNAKIDSAKLYTKKASSLYKKHQLWNKYIVSQNKLSWIYAEIEKNTKISMEISKKTLKKSIEIFGEQSYLTAQTYRIIAVIYMNRNFSLELTIEYLTNSLSILLKLPNKHEKEIAKLYNTLANAYQGINDIQTSLNYHSKAMQLNIKLFGKKNIELANSYRNIGYLYLKTEKPDSALHYYSKSLEIVNNSKNTDILFSIELYTSITELLIKMKEYDKALKIIAKIELLNKQMTGRNFTYNLRNNYKSICYYHLKKYNKALKYIQKCIINESYSFKDSNILSNPKTSNFKNFKATNSFGSVSFKMLCLKGLYTQRNNKIYLQAAIATCKLTDSIADLHKQAATFKSGAIYGNETHNQFYKNAINLFLFAANETNNRTVKKEYFATAHYFLEKSKSFVLNSSLSIEKSKDLRNDFSMQNIEQEIAALEIQIANTKNDKTELYRELFAFRRKKHTNDDLLSVNLTPDTINYILNISKIQENLEKKTLLLNYFSYENKLFVFKITATHFSVEELKIESNFNDKLKLFQTIISSPPSIENDKTYKQLARYLHNVLLPSKIKRDINKLIIIPNSKLAQIPFEAFLTKDINSANYTKYPYLIQKYAISYAYSASIFIKFQKKKINYSGKLLAAAPIFKNSETNKTDTRNIDILRSVNFLTIEKPLSQTKIPTLYSSENEIIGVDSIFNKNKNETTILINSKASEKNIKNNKITNYNFLHFATHGFSNLEKQALSGIIFAQDNVSTHDNILYYAEIEKLRLTADLCILSACESGTGRLLKSEGVLSLSHAFISAGTKNVIASLWKVSDVSTTKLIIQFYSHLFADKKKFSYALQQAKLELINSKKYAHPFYWAAFILNGN